MGPDEGANGCRTHDFATLLATKTIFPSLLELYIRPTDVGNHNFSEVADDQLPNLLVRCPELEKLTLPHAPEAEFFTLPFTNLSYLRIGMGYRLYNFIGNLSKKSNMPKLTTLDFSDSLSTFEVGSKKSSTVPTNFAEGADFFKALHYSKADLAKLQIMNDSAFAEAMSIYQIDDSYTSFEDYSALFASKALSKNSVFHVRNAYLTEAEYSQLEKMRPDLQFSSSIEAPHIFVSHWHSDDSKPFKHLVIPR
jgi:hypothetical protein